MRWLLLLLGLFCLECSDSAKNPVLAKRNRTPLENKILGAWKWSFGADWDKIEFKSDLTFSGVMNNISYSGTFTLWTDSMLKMSRDMTVNGLATIDNFSYKLVSLDAQKLVLKSSQQNLTYVNAD